MLDYYYANMQQAAALHLKFKYTDQKVVWSNPSCSHIIKLEYNMIALT